MGIYSEGWCWPGASIYTDFLNAEARDYFAEQYKLDAYKGSTLDCYTWNDMNEPSVFNGPEVTMTNDEMHGYVEHRDLHNMYGMLYTMAIHKGHLVRSENTPCPFVLTRSACVVRMLGHRGMQLSGLKTTLLSGATWRHPSPCACPSA